MTTESELNNRIRCLASDLGLYEDDPEGDSVLKQWVADNGLELGFVVRRCGRLHD